MDIDPKASSLHILRRNRDELGDRTHSQKQPGIQIPAPSSKREGHVNISPESYTKMLLFLSKSRCLVLPKQVCHCLELGDACDFKHSIYHLRSMIFVKYFSWNSFPQREHTYNFWIPFLIFLLEACFSFCSARANFGPFYMGQKQIGYITEIAKNPNSNFSLYRMSQLVYF